jgi:hypothetical protein
VWRTVIITGSISMVILAVMFVLRYIARPTLGSEYTEFAMALGLFLVLIAGAYWFVVLGQGRRT